MQLWNDYEGKTLAGIFPIEALLFTEGRNASFATRDRASRPAVLRLTEALNDQREMRERFSAVQSVGQRNLVRIEDFGDVEMEGTPLIYLVMEATDEGLAAILGERPLSSDETGEVALSLLAALEALHAHELVHGKVEPASVFAVGQVIKLRSDCVRAAPEGEEGSHARAADVFGLADVLNRCLTQHPLQEASDALALPEPYASIVRNVVRGTWGLEQVAGELRRTVRPAVAPQPERPALPLVPAPAKPEPGSRVVPDAAIGPPQSVRQAVRAGTAPEAQLPLVYVSADRSKEEDAVTPEAQQPGGTWRPSLVAQGARGPLIWVAAAVILGLLMILVWHWKAAPGQTRAAATNTSPALTPGGALGAPPVGLGTPAEAAPVPNLAPKAVGPDASGQRSGQVWRVVGYTYNVEAQAQAKAHAIEERHAGLHPEVFSRTGHAPYLVTLGGPLTRTQASAMLQQARRQGLARDLYMQNYSH